MNTTLKNSLLSSLVLVLIATSGCSKVLSTPKAEKACTFVQNKNKQRVSWKSNLPIKFRVHKSVPEVARESLIAAATQWNVISTQNVIEIIKWDVEGSPENGYADGAPTIYWLTDWESDRSSEQARTTVVWSGDDIRDSDIKINAKNFKFSYEEEAFQFTKVDFVSLIVHEMGHALGFAHSGERESVMYPLLAKGKDRRHIHHVSDLESYSCEYGNDIVKAQVMAAALQTEVEPEHNHEEEVENGEEEEEVAATDDESEQEQSSSAPGETAG